MEIIKKVTHTPITISDEIEYNNTPVLSYKIVYPEFISGQYLFAIEKINAFYKRKTLEFKKYIMTTLKKSAISDYKNSIKKGYPVHKYEAVLNYTVTYNQSCAISLFMDKYEYTGGAHGNTIRTSETWDLNNGQQVPLKSLFPYNPNYSLNIRTIIKKQIADDISKGNNYYFDDYEKLVDRTFNPKSFYLTPGALVIYFQQYDIAPYSSGILTFNIPYNDINASKPYCE